LVNDFCDEDDVESDGESSAHEPMDLVDIEQETAGLQKYVVLLYFGSSFTGHVRIAL
jgi:hypothetical protein